MAGDEEKPFSLSPGRLYVRADGIVSATAFVDCGVLNLSALQELTLDLDDTNFTGSDVQLFLVNAPNLVSFAMNTGLQHVKNDPGKSLHSLSCIDNTDS